MGNQSGTITAHANRVLRQEQKRELGRLTNQLEVSNSLGSDATAAKRQPGTVRYVFSEPSAQDGADIWDLVKADGTLDLNSPYAYLLTGKHFGDTSVVARTHGRLAGFTWAYIPKPTPDALFVWQIGVATADRGQGLATAMLERVIARPACANVRYVEATVTPSNTASRALFEGLARNHGTRCITSRCFARHMFPAGNHEAELLMRIGPLDAAASYS